MHPQMQDVFAQYISDYYKQEINIQSVLTTHSHEVVRVATISQLRVLRQVDHFKCDLFDLREFQSSIMSDKDLLEFYNWFYTINFPDIIFADKIILYEGDTERMLIKSMLHLDEFFELRNQYLSFVQVGEAYALNYKPIIDFLGIRAVIITDLDYSKNSTTAEEILSSNTTNATINKFAEIYLKNPKPTIQLLYDWQTDSVPIVVNNFICLAFQSKNDGYARTLEGAMLAKLYGVSCIDAKTKSEWKNLRKYNIASTNGVTKKELEELQKNYESKFTIPQGDDDCNLNTIVLHTSNGKTDFMYSVILKNLTHSMIPDYIKEALLWLIK